MRRNSLLRGAALLSSLLLAGGFIYYRSTGSLPWTIESKAQAGPPGAAPAAAKAVMSGSKYLVIRQSAGKPSSTAPASAPADRVLIYSSKSGAIVLPAPPGTQPAASR